MKGHEVRERGEDTGVSHCSVTYLLVMLPTWLLHASWSAVRPLSRVFVMWLTVGDCVCSVHLEGMRCVSVA